MITEDKLEQLCLDWFLTGGYGYDYAFGLDIAHCDDVLPPKLFLRESERQAVGCA